MNLARFMEMAPPPPHRPRQRRPHLAQEYNELGQDDLAGESTRHLRPRALSALGQPLPEVPPLRSYRD